MASALAATADEDTVAAERPLRADHARRRLVRALIIGLVLVGVGGLVWLRGALVDEPQVDLRSYLRAFELIAAGQDPYAEPSYLYPPCFAVVGAALVHRLGQHAFVIAFRAGCLAGVWVLAWVSLDATAWGLAADALAALLLAFSPLLGNVFGCGNISPLVIGLAAVGAWLAVRGRAALPGLVLGTLNAFKPMAVGALAVVATPIAAERRGQQAWRAWRRRFAILGGTALVASSWLLLGARYLPSWLSRSGGAPGRFYNVSLHSALHAMGVVVPAWLPFLAATVVGIWLAWRRGDDPRQRLAIATTTCLIGLPVISPGTFLLNLPAQALALDTARIRWRGGAAASSLPRWRRVGEVGVVCAAVLSVHGSLGGIALGGAAGGVVQLIPLSAAAALTLYPLRFCAATAETDEAAALVAS